MKITYLKSSLPGKVKSGRGVTLFSTVAVVLLALFASSINVSAATSTEREHFPSRGQVPFNYKVFFIDDFETGELDSGKMDSSWGCGSTQVF